MTDYLKGNYPLDAKIEEPEVADCNAFERLATSRLGGSICFVKGGPLVWVKQETA